MGHQPTSSTRVTSLQLLTNYCACGGVWVGSPAWLSSWLPLLCGSPAWLPFWLWLLWLGLPGFGGSAGASLILITWCRTSASFCSSLSWFHFESLCSSHLGFFFWIASRSALLMIERVPTSPLGSIITFHVIKPRNTTVTPCMMVSNVDGVSSMELLIGM